MNEAKLIADLRAQRDELAAVVRGYIAATESFRAKTGIRVVEDRLWMNAAAALAKVQG